MAEIDDENNDNLLVNDDDDEAGDEGGNNGVVEIDYSTHNNLPVLVLPNGVSVTTLAYNIKVSDVGMVFLRNEDRYECLQLPGGAHDRQEQNQYNVSWG